MYFTYLNFTNHFVLVRRNRSVDESRMRFVRVFLLSFYLNQERNTALKYHNLTESITFHRHYFMLFLNS